MRVESYFQWPKHGWVAERLGRGLQNLVRRFESAPNLKMTSLFRASGRGFVVSASE
mgnify:CR=1 FL=1